MFLRVFLLLGVVVALALFARAFLLRSRFLRDMKIEEEDLRRYLHKILEEQAQKMHATNDAIPCTLCGVALLEKEGVRDENDRFFCCALHMESFHQQQK